MKELGGNILDSQRSLRGEMRGNYFVHRIGRCPWLCCIFLLCISLMYMCLQSSNCDWKCECGEDSFIQ